MAGPAARSETRRSGSGKRFGLVVARFHEAISTRLLEGAVEALSRHGVREKDIRVVWVPGSFELPQVALTLARSRRYHALICLGVVIRGETPHWEHVARIAAEGISHVGLSTGIPTAFGVITAENQEQAWARSGGKVNRGEEAALAALEMAWLGDDLSRRSKRRPR
ncbi:MAG: 6,7-dimethyl-8-ribityllumazine synthase [Candidatus Rokubacteria bacterium]|nr:6,7-dimethyl-8-ribityllumazine synthase [Candidatus Rokubacteria bacterium]